jgi:stearoyl-CoA desaturase (Delta-9 desaturase)
MATTFPAPATTPVKAPAAPTGPAVGAATAVGTVRSRTGLVSRLITLVAVLVPPIGLVVALVQLWGSGVRVVDVALLVGLYAAGGLGVTVGFHRLFSHRAFVAGPAVRTGLAVLGSITLQGPVTQWVTDHRKHHAFADRPGDPHSPHTSGGGVRGALAGFFHSHVGWMFVTKGMERGEIYGRDLFEDPLIRTIDRLYLVWVLVSLLVPFGVGWLVRGTLGGAVEALAWGGLLRIFLFHHATFCVNSVCHLFGRRPYETRDRSRNNWVVAVVTFGEGWHNNHHGFPRSARLGLTPGQVDPGWWLVRALERAGLAVAVRTPRPGGAGGTRLT